MNLVIFCKACLAAVRVMVELGKPATLFEAGQLVACPTCKAEVHLHREQDVDGDILSRARPLTEVEAMAATSGLGFPDEQQCSLEAVNQVLREQPVRRVVGHDIANTSRATVDYLELWDGTRVYMGASSNGAIAYRIQPPFSYAKRV